MWTKGTIEGYGYEAKHFEEESGYGISEGRISKLAITKDGAMAANYDRGWDIRPKTAEAERIYRMLLKKFN